MENLRLLYTHCENIPAHRVFKNWQPPSDIHRFTLAVSISPRNEITRIFHLYVTHSDAILPTSRASGPNCNKAYVR